MTTDNNKHHYQLGRLRNVRQDETNGKCREKANVKSADCRHSWPKAFSEEMSHADVWRGGQDGVHRSLCFCDADEYTGTESVEVKAGMDL